MTITPEDLEKLRQDYYSSKYKPVAAPSNPGLITSYNASVSQKQPTGLVYQNTQGVEDQRLADRIANTVMKPVANAVEASQKNPWLSWLVNPALNLAQAVGQYFIDPAMRVLSTPLLVGDALEQGKGLDYAWEQAQYISPGQALANVTFLPVDNIFDEKQRKDLYEDTWIGLLTSGGIDLGINILGSKGTGAATRGGRNLVLGSNKVKNVQHIRPAIEDAVAWGEAGATGALPNSWAKLIDDAVKTDDVVALRTSPLVQNSVYPDRLATLLAGTKTHRGVAEILMAERGDISALNRLRDELPLAHDALTDFGFDMTKPLTNWADIHKLPDGPEVDQYRKIISALAEKDSNFARSLDAFVDDTANQKYLSQWQPGRFAAVEKAKLLPKKFKMAALYGDWGYLKPSNQTGWVVSTRQGDRYTRGIRFFQYVNGAKARGYVNVSNPRMDESVTEIISELNRINFIRNNVDFKEKAISKYTKAVTDEERAAVIFEIERDVVTEMALHYNIGNMRSIFEAGGDISTQVRMLHDMYNGLNRRRQSAMDFVNKHGFIPDEDGNINFFSGGNFKKEGFQLTSTEAQNIPMMDFGRLEAALVNNLKNLEGTLGAVGSFGLKKKDIVSAALKEGTFGQAMMTVGMMGDRLHMLFSNTHLLRPGFIPKNSFLDNNMRAAMMLERPMGFTGGTAAAIVENLSRNTARRLTKIYPKTFKAKLGRDARLLQKEYDDGIVLIGGVQKNIANISTNIKRSEEKLAGMNAKLAEIKGKTPEAVDARQALNEKIRDEADRLKNFQVDLESEKLIQDNLKNGLQETSGKIARIVSDLEDDKAALKTIDKNSFTYKTVDGEVIEVKGAFDPNTKGGSYYESANSSMESWLYQSTMADSRLRLANQANDVELRYNPSAPEANADYFEALTNTLNRQVRNNEVGDMILKGSTDDEIFDWIKNTSSGREYMRRMALRIDSESNGIWLPDEKIHGWIAATRENIIKTFPSNELREIATRRAVTPKEVRAHLELYGDSLPTLVGPSKNVAYKSMTFGEKALKGPEFLAEKGWSWIGKFENKFARNPLFNEYYKEEILQAAKYIEANGGKVTYELLNGPLMQVARRKALARVDDTLYTSRRLTNGMYAMRYVMAFPAAYFNSQKVALKLMARNPYNAYWYNSVANSMDSAGVFGAYYEDTSTGTVYEKLSDVPDGVDVSVRFNIPEPAKDKLEEMGLGAYVDSALGGVAIPQKQLEFMLQDPSLAWTATATLSEVVKMADGDSPVFGKVTGLQIIDAMKKTFGEDFYNNSIFFQGNIVQGDNLFESLKNNIFPTSYRQLISAAFGNQSDEMLVNEANRLFRVQMRDWINSGSDPANKPVYDETVKAAKNVLLMRFFTWMNAPLSVSFDPASREAMMRYSQLMDKYKNAGGDQYNLATDDFVKLYGVGSLALLGSSNYRVLGQTSTTSGQDILYNHSDLIQEIVKNTGSAESAELLFWSPDGDAGDYQADIAALQKRMTVPGTGGQPIVRPKTAEEVRDDIEKRIGWYEYSKLDQLRQSEMEMYGVASTSETRYTTTGIRGRFMTAERALREKYPAWDRSRVFNTQNWYTVVGNAINTALQDEKWMKRNDSQLWYEIGRFMQLSDSFRDLYEGSYSSQSMSKYRVIFEQNYYQMLTNFSTQFGAFASRWLSNHPLLDRDFTEGVLSNG